VSLRSLLDRRISIITTAAAAKDRYGNTGRSVAATLAEVPARRDQVDADEDVRDRDQQARTFTYLIALRAEDGTAVALTGRDRIRDGLETLEILGSPELVRRRRLPHHWEARAVVVEG
jgi:hypothetical protein